MTALHAQVREGFLKYGTAGWVSSHYVKQSREWELKYKTKGYVGDVIPASWDDYVIIEEHTEHGEVDHGIIRDMEEEDVDVEEGFEGDDMGDE